MATRRMTKPYIDYLRKMGFEIASVSEGGGGHIKMRVTLLGNPGTTTVANSPSDRRQFENWKSDVRRMYHRMREECRKETDRSESQL